VHHSDAGSQYTSIRYSGRLADAGAVASIGPVGDSYDTRWLSPRRPSGAKRSLSQGGGRAGGQGGGSTSVYSTSSSRGGAAAFSAGSSRGHR